MTMETTTGTTETASEATETPTNAGRRGKRRRTFAAIGVVVVLLAGAGITFGATRDGSRSGSLWTATAYLPQIGRAYAQGENYLAGINPTFWIDVFVPSAETAAFKGAKVETEIEVYDGCYAFGRQTRTFDWGTAFASSINYGSPAVMVKWQETKLASNICVASGYKIRIRIIDGNGKVGNWSSETYIRATSKWTGLP
jgi:hypothetical protein